MFYPTIAKAAEDVQRPASEPVNRQPGADRNGTGKFLNVIF